MYGSLRLDTVSCQEFVGSFRHFSPANWPYFEGGDESMYNVPNSLLSEKSCGSCGVSLTSSFSSLSLYPMADGGQGRRGSMASSDVANTNYLCCNDLCYFKFCDLVGQDLWKENPEQDHYNTFSVSENDLTSVIGFLESQLESHRSKSAESSNDLQNSMQDDLKKAIPPKVTFILDTYCHIYMYGKQDLRELKLLQKLENKQYQDLSDKSKVARDLQERKFEVDMQSLLKNYDQDMDMLTKQQKQQVEKAEASQAFDLKATARRIKLDQEKELKSFKEKQKQDMKLQKQELDFLAKTAKKEEVRRRKEEKEIQLAEEERVFLEQQQERMDKHMKQLTETHRQKIAMLEGQFLQHKQHLRRGREAAIWELEKQQLHERHQLSKSQLKDMFFLKRHQMLTRHQKEIEQMKRSNQVKEEEMQHRHVLEKKRLPKILKQESKTRSLMFKQSLRLSIAGNPEDERSKLKQFEENEKKRMKSEMQRQENKHKKQWEDLIFRNETSLRELEQLQAEKRKMLMEHETQKIKELDDHYANEHREWKTQLIPRKQKLEEEFARQREEQEQFYGTIIITGNEGSPLYTVPRSAPSSVRSKTEDSLKSRHSTII